MQDLHKLNQAVLKQEETSVSKQHESVLYIIGICLNVKVLNILRALHDSFDKNKTHSINIIGVKIKPCIISLEYFIHSSSKNTRLTDRK